MSSSQDENQPEIYERIPEQRSTETGEEFIEPENERLDRRSLNPREAAKAFQYSSSAAEAFSGIFHGQTEFEIIGKYSSEEPQETPLQKFQRLRIEIQQLSQELEGKDEQIEKEVSSKALLGQVNQLQKQLQDIKEKKFDQEQLNLPTKLISQLKATTGQPGLETNPPSSSDGQITYELYYRPNLPANVETAKISDLDVRLARLESLIGTANAQVDEGNLVGWLTLLEEKVRLLTPTQIGKLKQTYIELSKEAQKKAQQPASTPSPASAPAPTLAPVPALAPAPASNVSQEFETKVNELFDKVEKWDEYLHTLPQIVERLRTLRTIHQQAALFSETLKNITQEQASITDLLQSQEKVLKTVEGNLAQNSAAVQSNIDHLDKRISDLLQKISQLK